MDDHDETEHARWCALEARRWAAEEGARDDGAERESSLLEAARAWARRAAELAGERRRAA